MASGILLASGQNWVIDRMKEYFDVSGMYVGLMTNSTQPSEGDQLPTNISEVSGSGYSRQVCSTWTKYNDGGVDPYLQGNTVTFEASGTWTNVYGYFVGTDASGNSALWAELFPAAQGGTKYNGDKILITPRYEQKYEGEA